MLAFSYFVGRYRERAHLKALDIGERETKQLTVVTFEPAGWNATESNLVTGSVVISIDYFKRFSSNFKSLVGGRLRAYEPMMERGRREAILRMKRSAQAQGFDAIVNLRLETSKLASGNRSQKGIAGIEVLAFGTGIKRA
jgi:uncharacterized protein YbjQ (UPF0145 family)